MTFYNAILHKFSQMPPLSELPPTSQTFGLHNPGPAVSLTLSHSRASQLLLQVRQRPMARVAQPGRTNCGTPQAAQNEHDLWTEYLAANENQEAFMYLKTGWPANRIG